MTHPFVRAHAGL